jgi:hypothetical protein
MAPIGRAPRFWLGNGLGAAIGASFLRTGAFPLVSSASAISNSCVPLLLCARARLGAMLGPRGWIAVIVLLFLGGPGAIGTTPPDFEFEEAGARLTLDDTPPPDPVDFGDSDSAAFGVVTGVIAMEFLRDDFFEARVEDGPTGVLPLPRLRFLMTSVLSDSGRTTPCSFRNRPQALQRGAPSGLRRQRGVVWVKQLVQVVGAPPSPGFVPPGL